MKWRALASALGLALLLVPATGGSEGSQPRFGGTVVVVQPYGPEPECLGPVAPCEAAFSPAFPTHSPIVNQVLEGAFEIAPDLTYRLNLVSRVTVKKQPFELTYHIRRDARWGDGPPITAGDFVFTHRLLLEHGAAEDPHRKIRRVLVVNAKTARVVIGEPLAAWRDLFRRIYPRHALAGRDLKSVWRDGIVNPKTGEPTGSGPFLIERWERGRRLTLVRNRHWRPRRPYLDRIVFRFDLPNPFTALGSGVHLVETFRNPGRHATAGPIWEHIAIRMAPGGHPALRKVLVRKALAYGIDRSALLRRLSYGRAGAGRLLDNGLLVTNSRFYERHWHVYRHRPAEARRLLELAGCTRAPDAIYACAGQRLSLRLVARGFRGGGSSELERVGIPLLQEQLRGIGVEVVPVFPDVREFFETVLPARDFDLALFTLPGGPEPDERRRWPGPAAEIWGCDGQTNFTGYCNRQVTRKLRQSQVIVDQQTRMRLLNRVDVQMARDVPMIPLFQVPYMLSYAPALRGVRNNPWEGFTWNSEDWWLAR
jgi:peptide/nickel transport system substrate-binding protein